MKVTFLDQKEFRTVHDSSSTGFYRDANDNLYLVHAYGVSRIGADGSTSSFRFGDLNIPPLQRVSKGTISITF